MPQLTGSLMPSLDMTTNQNFNGICKKQNACQMIDFMHSCEKKIEMLSDLSFPFFHSFIDQQLVHRFDEKKKHDFEISHTSNPS